MTPKLTYEELEQRVHDLEKKLARRADRYYLEALFNKTHLPAFIKDHNFEYILMNHQLRELCNVVGKQIRGQNDFEIFSGPVAMIFREQDEKVVQTQTAIEFEETITLPDGGDYSFMTSKFPLIDNNGKVYAVCGICTDITAHKKTQADLIKAKKSLRKSHEKLEQRVADRTAQLNQRTEELMEINIALKVLLKKREEDKKEFEETLMFNFEKIVYPYLKKLRLENSKASQHSLLTIIETNLDELTLSLSQNRQEHFAKLTPMQIQVANLVKQGLTSKEIASFLHLSPSTIANHRQEIRKRLSLNNRKINLQTTLTSPIE